MRFVIILQFIAAILASTVSCNKPAEVQISGELKQWHTITLTFTGPRAGEYDTLNPFTDYLLDVEFTNGNRSFTVPGYFAADGNASETSAKSGNIWLAKFSPPSPGEWRYDVTFAKGRNIADPSKDWVCLVRNSSTR